MAKASPIIYSFNSGELSPLLDARVDPTFYKYKTGCSLCENFIPSLHGPVVKRPGTRFVTEVKNSTHNTTLLEFEFGVEQAYILEFGDKYIRFYMNGGVILSSGVPLEIVTPYLHTDVDELQVAQSADVMYIVHKKYPPHKLSRLSHDSWTLTVVNFQFPVFQKENIDTDKRILFTTTDDITWTLDANFAVFTPAHVGTKYKMTTIVESHSENWRPGLVVTTDQFVNFLGNVYQATTSGTTGSRAPVHEAENIWDGGVNWTYHSTNTAVFIFTQYVSSIQMKATWVVPFPQYVPAQYRWSFEAWNATRGYPSTITFYEDRLCLAGSIAQPQTIWASVVGDYENFKMGTKADDAWEQTINARQVNSILWMESAESLIIGTSRAEYLASSSSPVDTPMTPLDARVVSVTNHGTAINKTFKIGHVVIFIQRGQSVMREFAYRRGLDVESESSIDVSLLAEHILESGIVDMTWFQNPDRIIWCCRKDGVLVGLTYERKERVVAWHRHDLGGKVLSVASIPHWDLTQDSTWMIVERVIDGSTKRYVEYLEKHLTTDKMFYVDSGLSYDGAPTTTVTGLTHLEGQTVRILADNKIVADKTVTSGSITLDVAASVVQVGLNYDATVTTMKIEAGAADGTAAGKTKRITNVVIRLHNTGPGIHYGSGTVLDPLTHHDLNLPVQLTTGDSLPLPWPIDYEQDGRMTIKHKQPVSCTLVALMPQVHTFDR